MRLVPRPLPARAARGLPVTAPPLTELDRLRQAVDFYARRFVATAAELTELRARVERVRAALLMGGQSAEVRCRAALAALDGEPNG